MMVHKSPGAEEGGRGEENMRWVEREVKMEGYKALNVQKCTAEEEEQGGSEQRCKGEEVEVAIRYRKKEIKYGQKQREGEVMERERRYFWRCEKGTHPPAGSVSFQPFNVFN